MQRKERLQECVEAPLMFSTVPWGAATALMMHARTPACPSLHSWRERGWENKSTALACPASQITAKRHSSTEQRLQLHTAFRIRAANSSAMGQPNDPRAGPPPPGEHPWRASSQAAAANQQYSGGAAAVPAPPPAGVTVAQVVAGLHCLGATADWKE